MGKIEVSSPVFEKQNLIKESGEIIDTISRIFQELFSRAEDKSTLKDLDTLLLDFREDLKEPDLSLDTARDINSDLRYFIQRLVSAIDVEVEERDKQTPPGEESEVAVLERRNGEGRIRITTKFLSQAPDSPLGTRDPLVDLENIRNSAKSGLVKVSSDLWRSGMGLLKDSLSLVSETTREKLRKKEEEGKLIAGTLVGLKGGGRYLKVFNLALAQTLYEQSKYYKTQDNLSGVPRELISQFAGEGAIIEQIKDPKPGVFKGGTRPYPIILLIWEDIAKKMSATGKISGGKDIKVVRDFVQGYTQKVKDPKTGKEKTAYIPGLLGREYLVEGEKSIIGVPYMTKLFSLYPKDTPDKEVGIAVQLSPLFAKSIKFGYTGIRSDTIKNLGGAKQREITINLFYFLAYNRGIPAQRGRKPGEFVKRKEDVLKEVSEGLSYYDGRPGRLETHFQEAIQKCIDAKILLSGKTKTGLRGYREEKNPAGQNLSIFTYNPDYLKGEEINLFSEVEDQ